ncbi:MAG: DUF938 domain-containing protein [Pseudomonadota bacterium]
MMDKPWSEACERNAGPIGDVLAEWFAPLIAGGGRVLEIGSGTGQHAAAFAGRFSALQWQPSDVPAHLEGIRAWTQPVENCAEPLSLDVLDTWPDLQVDAAYTANTLHIMSWQAVEACFHGLARTVVPGGLLAVYGPFRFAGEPFAESNVQFDAFLRQRDPQSGIRTLEALMELAQKAGWAYRGRQALPANNHLLLWRRLESV